MHCSFADIKFIKSITLDDMYAFVSYLQKERNCSVATCGRKIISIRQFWKYLKTKARLIDNNIAEELEVPKQAKRMPKYLNLEDSIRLLMSVEGSPRNYCIVTLFLNCALRLAELTNLNEDQISAQSVTVIGRSDKERQIYLTPAAKNAVNAWLIERNNYNPKDNALFISNRGVRLTTRAIQIVIKNAVEAAGLSQDITPHKLRHTAATLLGHNKNRQYTRNFISNEDIIKSYTLIPVIEGEKAAFSHELPIIFLRLTDNPYYLDWGQLTYEFANYSNPDFKVVSGGQTYLYNANVTRMMISIMGEMLKGGYRKDPRLISVISEHKGVIYRKIEYFVEKGILSPNDNLINEFKKIKDESQLCLSLFLKYQMTNMEKTAISIVDKLSYIIEGELKGFKYVSEALNDYLEKIKWDKELLFNNSI